MPTRKITRVGRRSGMTGPQPQQRISESASLVDFMNALQLNDIAFLPVSPHTGLGILGRGLSGLIQQSTADSATMLAFKEGIPSKNIRDTEQDQDWYSLVTEVTVLQHGPVKANPHIVDLVGISFSVLPDGTMNQRAWPFVIISKVNYGDLTTILRDNKDDCLKKRGRMILFAGFAEALIVLHSCGITHGDLKTDNVLVNKTQNNQLSPKLIDFGSSAISGQSRNPTKSEPWNAPELEVLTKSLGHDELIQNDLYSFGLVCLHLLLPIETLVSAKLCLIQTQDQSDDQWAQFLRQMRHRKALRGGDDLVIDILETIESADVEEDRKCLLKNVVEATVKPPPGKRTLPWPQILPYIHMFLSNSYHNDSRFILQVPPLAYSSATTDHSKHRIFDLGSALGELDDVDYMLHISILQELQHKADHSGCQLCRVEYAFQVSLCCMIGFGCSKDVVSSEKWLLKSKRNKRELEEAIEEIGRQYRPPGRVSKDVRDVFGLGVIVSTERTQEYQTSRRLVEAERALRDRIEARTSLFGEYHLCLSRSESELAQVLQAQFRLMEAETYQVRASNILRDHLGDRHPSVLMANVDLANLKAKQGLLREAEELALETQPIITEVLGPEHPETVTTLQSIAIIQAQLGKYKEAENFMIEAVSCRKRALTSTHPLTVRAELSFATVLMEQGRLTEASKLMESIDLRLAGMIVSDHLGRAQLSLIHANCHRKLGFFEKALEKITETMTAMDKLKLLANDPLRLEVLEMLALIHGDNHENGKEEEILRQILELEGGGHERGKQTLLIKCHLARSLLSQLRLSEAYVLAEEVLFACDRSITQDPDSYLSAIDTMALVLTYRGQLDEAEKIRQDTLSSCAAELGEGHTFTLSMTYLLGLFLADRGENQKAQHLYEQTLVQLERDARPGTDMIKLKRLLAVILVEQGNFDKAKTECQQGITLAISAIGEDHVESLLLYMTLGRVYILTGNLAEADELYSAKFQKKRPPPRAEVYILEHTAVLRRRQHRYSEAMELKRKSEALMRSLRGELHPEFVRMQGNVLADYMAQAELFTDNIEQDVLKNIDRKKDILGARHPSTIMTMCDLAYAYALKGRLIQADKLFRELEETGNLSAVKSPEQYAKILGKRAEVNFRLGHLEAAEDLEQEALAIRLSIFDDSHASVLVNMGNLASTLCARGKYEEAEGYVRHAMTVRERSLEATVPSISSFLLSRTALGAILYYQNKLDESANLYRTSITLAEEIGLPATRINAWKEELSKVLAQSEGSEMMAVGSASAAVV